MPSPNLDAALDAFLTAIRSPASASAPEQLQTAAQNLLDAARDAPRDSVHRAMRLLAADFDFDAAPSSAYAAVVAGSLVEAGYDPATIEEPLVRELRRALQLCAALADACEAALPPDEDDEEDPDERFEAERERLSTRMPAEAQAWRALEVAWCAGVAVFSFSPEARGRAQSLGPLAARLAERHQGAWWLDLILSVLHDEPLLVIEPSTRRGIRGRIRGVADNFQLQTLLMDVFPRGLFGKPRVPPHAVANARGEGPAEIQGYVAGAWNLYIWAAVNPSLALPAADDFSMQSHWIWGEARPAIIPAFEGHRVVLLGPPSYNRSWGIQRMFPHLRAAVEVDERLSKGAVDEWLRKMAHAAARAGTAG